MATDAARMSTDRSIDSRNADQPRALVADAVGDCEGVGPLILGRLSTLADFDYHTSTEAAVDGFLATHARTKPISAASTESAGA